MSSIMLKWLKLKGSPPHARVRSMHDTGSHCSLTEWDCKRNFKEFSIQRERVKFSLIIGDYWRVPECSKSSGDKIVSSGELFTKI